MLHWTGGYLGPGGVREILPYPSTLVGTLSPSFPRPIQTHSSVSMINHHTTSNSVLTPYGSMSNSLVVIPAGLPAAARCWLTVFFNFHCTIGNLKLSLGFQVMKSTSLSWSFVYRNVRCGNEWTIDALRLKHKILISDVSSSST